MGNNQANRPNIIMIVRHLLRAHAECTCGWRTDRRWFTGFALFDAQEHAARTGHLLAGPDGVANYWLEQELAKIRSHDEKFADMPRITRGPIPTPDGHPDTHHRPVLRVVPAAGDCSGALANTGEDIA